MVSQCTFTDKGTGLGGVYQLAFSMFWGSLISHFFGFKLLPAFVILLLDHLSQLSLLGIKDLNSVSEITDQVLNWRRGYPVPVDCHNGLFTVLLFLGLLLLPFEAILALLVDAFRLLEEASERVNHEEGEVPKDVEQ